MEPMNGRTAAGPVTDRKTTGGDATSPHATDGQDPAGNDAGVTRMHLGSCHCGAVRFEVQLDASTGGARCNCTICTKIAQMGAIVKPAAFRLLAGEASLSTYEWGGRTALRFFCKSCGIHTFARGTLKELGGAYVSINLNALDDIDVSALPLVHWDGRHNNWYAGPRPTPWPIAAETDVA